MTQKEETKCKHGNPKNTNCLGCYNETISTPHTEKEECKHEIVDYEPGHCFTCRKCGVCHGTRELFLSPSDKTWEEETRDWLHTYTLQFSSDPYIRGKMTQDIMRQLTSATIKAKDGVFMSLLRSIEEIPFNEVEKEGAIWAGTRVIDVFREYSQHNFGKTLESKGINLEEPKS